MSRKIAEFSIIKNFFQPLTNSVEAAQNLSDDVAKISLKKDEKLAVSKDIIVEDVHFKIKDGGFKIAAKLLRTNLSDLAASGAKPLYYMLGFSKNLSVNKKFLQDFSRGLKKTQSEFGLSLIGGDTVQSLEKLFFSITIFGIIKKNKILLRQNAKDGDLIFTSGNIGEAYIGLQLSGANPSLKNFTAAEKKYFLDRHFFPTPQIKLAQNLVEKNLSTCAIDISDGLLADLQHICNQSQLSATIYLDKIPLHKKTKINNATTLDLISAGDDYQLLFTVKKNNQEKIAKIAEKLKIKITYIGFLKKSVKKHNITILDEKNQKINFSKYGYQH